jgi:hypothetical protein
MILFGPFLILVPPECSQLRSQGHLHAADMTAWKVAPEGCLKA